MKVITLVALILGSFIGAGYCSGREVTTYFVVYGNYAYIMALVFSVIMFFVMRIFIFVGKQNNAVKTNVLCIIATIVIISSMLAGSVSLGEGNTIVSLIIYFVTIGIVVFTCYGGIHKVNKLNVYLVPLVVVVLSIICIFAKTTNLYDCDFHIFSGAGSVINYLMFNMLTMGAFLLSVGKYYTKKQITTASIIACVIIWFITTIMIRAVLNNSALILYDMPILSLSKSVSPTLYIITKLIVWLALLTTLIISCYAIMEKFAKFSQNKFICIVTILLLCSCISLLGFARIVKYLYTMLGVFGFVYVFDVLITYFSKNK